MTDDKNAQRERLLKKQEQMRAGVLDRLAWIAGMLLGLLAFQLIAGLLGLLLA